MELPKYIAIELLCKILDGMSEARRTEMVGHACISIGRSPDLTGLKRTRRRPIGQMFWDLTTNELRARMIELVEQSGIQQQTLVHGVVGYVESLLARHADPEFAETVRDNLIGCLARNDAQLALPIESREGKLPDTELLDSKQRFQKSLDDVDKRRQEAEEALFYLRDRTSSIFTGDFWGAVTMMEIGSPDRILELEEPDDEDMAE